MYFGVLTIDYIQTYKNMYLVCYEKQVIQLLLDKPKKQILFEIVLPKGADDNVDCAYVPSD